MVYNQKHLRTPPEKTLKIWNDGNFAETLFSKLIFLWQHFDIFHFEIRRKIKEFLTK